MILSPDSYLKKRHSQYYTTENLGDFLLNSIPQNIKYRNIIDLSAGKGALLNSARVKFRDALIVGFDIDEQNVRFLKDKYISHQTDSTTLSCYQQAKTYSKEYCLVLGNPPFKSIRTNKYIKDLFESFSLKLTSKTVRAEVVFILQSIKILKRNGVLAFIVPDGIITNKCFSDLRKLLCSEYNLVSVCEIPESSFIGTEARTHIIVLKKSAPSNTVIIRSFDRDSQDIKIPNEDFCFRGDYRYNSKPQHINTVSMETLCYVIKRGKYNRNSQPIKAPIIHTTSMNGINTLFDMGADHINDSLHTIAGPGDIVLARVGTRVIGRFGIIKKGYYIISDCVFLIKPLNEKNRNLIIATLNSDFGRKWIGAAAKGVGALHLTMQEIKKIPIFIGV